MPETAAAREKR